MPIKGLTDRNDVSFPKIGDIRKGEPKDKQGRVGRDLTYFRAEFVEGEEGAAQLFSQIHGEQPRELYVMLPFRSIERNWEAWQEAYTAGQLLHRCDGETCVLWYDKQTNEYRTDPKPCPGGCVPTGRLKVLIPDLRRLAFVEVHTTSINDILEITRNLEALQQLTGNGINGIPLVLKRRPRNISTPRKQQDGTTKRVRAVKWLLSIEAEPAWVEAQIGAMRNAALPSGYQRPALPERTGDGPNWNTLMEDIGAPVEASGPETDQADDADFEDAEYIEDEPEPEPPAKSRPAARPYPPETVKAAIQSRIKAGDTEIASQAQRGLVASKLNELFAGDGDADAKRHQLMHYLVGVNSTKALVKSAASALLAWVLAGDDPDGTGDYELHPAAVKEAAAIIRQVRIGNGQAELEL